MVGLQQQMMLRQWVPQQGGSSNYGAVMTDNVQLTREALGPKQPVTMVNPGAPQQGSYNNDKE
jgi:hypothetical protein